MKQVKGPARCSLRAEAPGAGGTARSGGLPAGERDRTRKGGHPVSPDDRPPSSGLVPVRARRFGTSCQVRQLSPLPARLWQER